MVATKTTTVDTKRSIISLTANGSNVRAWETDVHAALQMHGKNCMLLADDGMSVSAHKTLELDLKMQVERAIKAGRAEVVAEARFVTAETAVAKSRKMKAEDALASKMPKLEPMVDTSDTKEEVEVIEVSRATRESKMLARAAIIAARMKTVGRYKCAFMTFYLLASISLLPGSPAILNSTLGNVIHCIGAFHFQFHLCRLKLILRCQPLFVKGCHIWASARAQHTGHQPHRGYEIASLS